MVGSGCFKSEEMRSYIGASAYIGVCSLTGSYGNVVDNDDFHEFFTELLSLLSPSNSGLPLSDVIQQDWGLFADVEVAYALLDSIAKEMGFANGSNELVTYSKKVWSYVPSWEQLKNQVRYNSRFFAEQSDEDIDVWLECFQPNRVLSTNTVLYRGRLNQQDSSLYTELDDLKAPPAKYASSGRANSYGIPVLYLSTEKDTLMYETRSLYGDKLSIGEFHTLKDLNLVDFNYVPDLYREYNRSGSDTLIKAIRFHFLMQAISKDMSKPMRRYDNKEIEYVPTQYICEFIRQKGKADGIIFSSSLHSGGTNIVLFDVNAAECQSVEVFTVGQFNMHFE